MPESDSVPCQVIAKTTLEAISTRQANSGADVIARGLSLVLKVNMLSDEKTGKGGDREGEDKGRGKAYENSGPCCYTGEHSCPTMGRTGAGCARHHPAGGHGCGFPQRWWLAKR